MAQHQSLLSAVTDMEGDLRRRKGRLIRVETSAMEVYGPTRGFYAAMQYREEARFCGAVTFKRRARC